MQRVIAFDIGVKNLSYIDASVDANRKIQIHSWDIIDVSIGGQINSKDFMLLSESLLKILQHQFDPAMYHVILVENQPALKNPLMKSMQITLYTYFALHKVKNATRQLIRFVSATTKLKPNTLISKDMITDIEASYKDVATAYSKRKKMSVDLVDQILSSTHIITVVDAAEHANAFQKHKKKDDLADTFLMLTSHTAAL